MITIKVKHKEEWGSEASVDTEAVLASQMVLNK